MPKHIQAPTDKPVTSVSIDRDWGITQLLVQVANCKTDRKYVYDPTGELFNKYKRVFCHC